MNRDIKLDEVTLSYGNAYALRDVSCELKRGVTYGLIGRNGAGKTSLLSLIASYRRPSRGAVLVGNEDPFENTHRMPDVQFVYSRDMSEEDDPVETELRQCARYRENFDLEYAWTLAERFGLDRTKPLKDLSVGMQAAVNVIEGLASGVPITLFDEVHHGMDAPSRQLFYDTLLECHETGERTFVLSTHLISEMAYLFDHVLLLDRGNLVIDEAYDSVVGRGVTITGNAEIVDAFVGDRTVIDRRVLGGTASAMVCGVLNRDERLAAEARGLEVSPVSLQELFIHLTKEENGHAIDRQ